MRKKRISGVTKKGVTESLTFAASGIAGSIAASMLGSSLMPTMTGTTKGAILLAAGVALSSMSKDKLMQGLGAGVAISGGATLLGPTGLNVISGVSRVGRIGNSRIIKRGNNMQLLQQGVIGRNGQRLGDGVLGISGSKAGGSDFSANDDFR